MSKVATIGRSGHQEFIKVRWVDFDRYAVCWPKTKLIRKPSTKTPRAKKLFTQSQYVSICTNMYVQLSLCGRCGCLKVLERVQFSPRRLISATSSLYVTHDATRSSPPPTLLSVVYPLSVVYRIIYCPDRFQSLLLAGVVRVRSTVK